MLKKMRLRMILSAIFAFFSVIFIVSVLVNIINYGIVIRQADETLSYILAFENQRPSEILGPRPGDMPPMSHFFGVTNPESSYITRFFAVKFDENENVVSISTDNIASVDKTEAEMYAKQVLSNKADRGYMKEYRFLKETNNGNTTIIFLNMVQNLQSLRILRIVTVAVALGSLIIVSILVIIFSRGAIKPIANNIERQKQFITDASHELKTPLTSIMTSLDVISMEYGDNEWTENIRSQSERMSKLVSELVTLSRLDEENPLPNKENFSLSNAAWEIVEVYQSQAKAHGKILEVDIKDNISVVGEKNAIQLMLSVLLDNAIRYSNGDGDIKFNVSKSRNKIQIEVSNSCNFDKPIDVNRLFDRFYRPDSSRNVNHGGTGIGLAIAKTVAETHGGVITAKCPSGKKMIVKVII